MVVWQELWDKAITAVQLRKDHMQGPTGQSLHSLPFRNAVFDQTPIVILEHVIESFVFLQAVFSIALLGTSQYFVYC